MPQMGRPRAELTLTADEREQLTKWSRRAKSSQALALRSKIVLACAEGAVNPPEAAVVLCVDEKSQVQACSQPRGAPAP